MGVLTKTSAAWSRCSDSKVYSRLALPDAPTPLRPRDHQVPGVTQPRRPTRGTFDYLCRDGELSAEQDSTRGPLR
jgi:hypothetical protein